MPPRRSKRVKTLPETTTRSPSSNEAALSDQDRVECLHDTPTVSTTHGLLALPLELFDLVLAEFRTIEEEDILKCGSQALQYKKEALERTDVLRALSQTCLSLRFACLPRLWERLEACIQRGHAQWYRQVTRRLEAQCNGLANNPNLAKHVRFVTVTILKCSVDTVVPAFAHCLECLPNLHTLQLVHVHAQIATPLKKAFDGKLFPNIRTVSLPSCAHNILRACPEIVHITCSEGNGGEIVTTVSKYCSKVEVFHGLMPNKAIVKRMIKGLPKLRELHMFARDVSVETAHVISHDDIRLLSSLSKLSVIVIHVEDDGRRSIMTKDRINAACEIVKNSESDDEKYVEVIYSVWDMEVGHENGYTYRRNIRTERIIL